jgi:SAM-dependent methyltransferase
MDPEAMKPLGLALEAYFKGDADAQLIIRRDDGLENPLPVSYFFRNPSGSTAIDKAALDHCGGHVLDVGAGSGLHSIVLEERRFQVTPIDVSAQAVEIMKKRGLHNAQCADIFELRQGSFDTILMMGHGIGMVETIAGLDRFLVQARRLLKKDGQVLLDSADVRVTDDPAHLAYHEANRKAGRYIGEIRVELQFESEKGSPCGWLHVDPDKLRERAESSGWQTEVIVQESNGDYLAKLRT